MLAGHIAFSNAALALFYVKSIGVQKISKIKGEIMGSLIDKMKQNRAVSKQLQSYFRDTLMFMTFPVVFLAISVLSSLLGFTSVASTTGNCVAGFVLFGWWRIRVIKKHFARNHADEYMEMQQKISEACSTCWKYLLLYAVSCVLVFIGLVDGWDSRTEEFLNYSAIVLVLLGLISIVGGMGYWAKKCYSLYGVWLEIKSNRNLAEEVV